jgi:hypothetical protein
MIYPISQSSETRKISCRSVRQMAATAKDADKL